MTDVTVPVSVRVYHLQMLERPVIDRSGHRVSVGRVEVPIPQLNRFFYVAVGGDWLWWSRRSWTEGEWRAVLDAPGHETHIGSVDGVPVGYFELQRDADAASTEIAYFGLLPEAIGKGYGAELLAAAVDLAWADDTERVTLNTCSLDHPRALGNYRAAGFEVERVEDRIDHIPVEPLQPWPGAGFAPTTTVADHR